MNKSQWGPNFFSDFGIVLGSTVAVRGHSNVDELDHKQSEVLRLLDFYEDAVEKKIPDYLVGLATMILENIINLSRDVDQIVSNANR